MESRELKLLMAAEIVVKRLMYGPDAMGEVVPIEWIQELIDALEEYNEY